jgi:hypothetical protein
MITIMQVWGGSRGRDGIRVAGWNTRVRFQLGTGGRHILVEEYHQTRCIVLQQARVASESAQSALGPLEPSWMRRRLIRLHVMKLFSIFD